MKRNSFYIFNAGCIRRGVDCIRIKKYLLMNHFVEVYSPGKADYMIISTCGVVRKNEENSIRAIQYALDKNKTNARIIITGCLSRINPKVIEKLGQFIYIPNGELEQLDAIIHPSCPFNGIPAPDTVKEGGSIVDYLIVRSFNRRSALFRKLFDIYAMNNLFLKFSAVYFKYLGLLKKNLKLNAQIISPYYNIKIADGCLSECTFCATKFATKKLQSRPMDEIIVEFTKGVKNGYQVFQLLSEDSGCYGYDIGTDITSLLTEIFKTEGTYRIILIDFNPVWLIKQKDRLLPLLIKNKERIQEIFLPFQSGSDKVLSLMKRQYTTQELLPCLQVLNQTAPVIKIRTSVLVGFPGETEEDFQESVNFIKNTHFYEVAVNRYEDRPLTESSRFVDKIPQNVIEKRASFLVDKLGCKMLS